MSSSQLKKSMSLLRSYLGKDSHGQELLAAVARSTNDIRVASRIETERADDAEKQLALVREYRDEVWSKHQVLMLENDQLKDKLNRAESVADIASSKVVRLLEKSAVGVTNIADFAKGNLDRLVNSLLHQFGGPAPLPLRSTTVSHGAVVMKHVEFEISQLLPELSDESLKRFGQFIFMHSMMFDDCTIRITLPFKIKDLKKDCSTEDWDRRVMKVLKLFKRRIDFNDPVRDTLRQQALAATPVMNNNHY